MKTLILPVKREYFDAIKAGTKIEENRRINSYWNARLFRPDGNAREFSRVIITLGYPSKNDTSRRIVFPWRGFTRKTITHKHFGSDPVGVYSIRLTEPNTI